MILEVIAALIIHGTLKALFAVIGGTVLALRGAKKAGDFTKPDETLSKRGAGYGAMAYYIIALIIVLVVVL